MAYNPTNYKDNDPTTPLSAANLNNTERGVKTAHEQISALRAEIRDLPTTSGVTTETVKQIIADALDSIELPVGWIITKTDTPPTEGTWREGTLCYTMERGRVYVREGNKWVYQGFTATAVQDQQIAFEILHGTLTQAALAEITGLPIPFMDDYGQKRVQFAGRDWVARDSAWKTGGPMAGDQWDRRNVTINQNKAVLRLSPRGGENQGVPAGAELVSVSSLGYGTYEVAFTTDFSKFDKYAAFGLFFFDWDDSIPGHGEIDLVEISRWGKTNLAAKLTHYPDNDPVHSPEFAWPPTLQKGIVRLVWEPGRLTWTLINGDTKATLHTATTTERVPTHRRQKLHINLWAFNADGWENAKETTVTIESFQYIRHATNSVAGLEPQEVDRRISQAVQESASAVDTKITQAVDKLTRDVDTKISQVAGNTTSGGSLFSRLYQRGRRYLTVPTYWWADADYNPTSNWKFIFRNLDVVPFVLMNPSSGVGTKKEPDFVRHLARMKALNTPVLVYVRTVTDLANRVMRPADQIQAEVAKYIEFYGRDNIAGVFLDEVYNGWDMKYDAQKATYLGIFQHLRTTYGDDFLIVVNPGSPTTDYLVDAVDVILCFEQNPTTFRNSLTGLNPDWYKNLPPGKLWVAIHDVTTEAEAREILTELEKLNIANVYLTTDTFSGVIGSENQNNNPWDNLPAPWLQELQTDWMRHNLLPESVQSYSGGQPPSAGGVHVVKSAAEAARLPVGSLYAIISATSPSVVATSGGSVNGASFKPIVDGATTGDKIIIAVNTKGVSSMTITPPRGFSANVNGYWAGTERFWLFTGNYADDLTVTASETAEFAYSVVAIRNAGSVTVGTVKTRGEEPNDAPTIALAPHLEHSENDLVLGFAFERTSATETAEQVTVSKGWEKLHFTPQNGNYQTVLVAKGGTGDLTVTYPNTQNLNAGGVQVVARG